MRRGVLAIFCMVINGECIYFVIFFSVGSVQGIENLWREVSAEGGEEGLGESGELAQQRPEGHWEYQTGATIKSTGATIKSIVDSQRREQVRSRSKWSIIIELWSRRKRPEVSLERGEMIFNSFN